MRDFFFVLILSLIVCSCSHKKHLVYISDLNKKSLEKVIHSTKNNIEIGDVLKIDVFTVVPEVSMAYNETNSNLSQNNIELLIINGYKVDENNKISFPILGEISILGYDEFSLARKIKDLLVLEGHLMNPHVKVKKINSKFTVLGEVAKAGTYRFYDDQLNIFQALGYAGDLLITAKRNNVTLIREENGLRKTYKFSLTKKSLLSQPFYFIKNNDILIVEPNFSKVKSAGFIGSPQSIASISSLLLSITLLLINN